TFIDHADRDAFIARFVHDYNRTRLKCLGYQAPIQAVAKLTGLNTFAKTTNYLWLAPALDGSKFKLGNRRQSWFL
ncbi:hypothetical protein, partial [Bradyrhizobium sp. BRP56]|uniref:hypothetical protein n=1 Tax=Bradyrhizobium sp. BRP56 TaxID=2793819 RepID=UPI001CD752AC